MTIKTAASTPQLVARARDPAMRLHQQHAAFTQLVERTHHLVFGLALTVLRDPEEAKDVAQDAYLTAWRCLRQLRDGSAFGAWLKTIVTTECSRRLRRRKREAALAKVPGSVEADVRRTDYQSLVAAAIRKLSQGERDVTVLFYFRGHTQAEIGRLLRLKPGTVGKRLHSARLRIRRALPPSVRHEFVRVAPSKSFLKSVGLGLFDEYVGVYRFAERPDLVVSVVRDGDSLFSECNGQRNRLASLADRSLLTSHYDGEGRFGRNRRGAITHFVYYEFGKRLGTARRTTAGAAGGQKQAAPRSRLNPRVAGGGH